MRRVGLAAVPRIVSSSGQNVRFGQDLSPGEFTRGRKSQGFMHSKVGFQNIT